MLWHGTSLQLVLNGHWYARQSQRQSGTCRVRRIGRILLKHLVLQAVGHNNSLAIVLSLSYLYSVGHPSSYCVAFLETEPTLGSVYWSLLSHNFYNVVTGTIWKPSLYAAVTVPRYCYRFCLICYFGCHLLSSSSGKRPIRALLWVEYRRCRKSKDKMDVRFFEASSRGLQESKKTFPKCSLTVIHL